MTPTWAEMTLRTLSSEFAIPLESVSPVDVYIDCDEASRSPSRFNRFTKAIVLNVGQADLPRLFIHEATHLFIDSINGSPWYWVDQGLAEYMESRCPLMYPADLDLLLPPLLEVSPATLAAIGSASAREVPRRLSRRAIDEGWSWAPAFIHYLLEYRWADRTFSQKVRILMELDDDDVTELAPDFLAFFRSYDPAEDFLRRYEGSPRSGRLLLLGQLQWHVFPSGRILNEVLVIEQDAELCRLAAAGALSVAPAGMLGTTFERVARHLHPEPIPDLDPWRSWELGAYLVEKMNIMPTDLYFPIVAKFLAKWRQESILPLTRVIEWVERYPGKTIDFAMREEVQSYFVQRLDAVDPAVLETLLAALSLVRSDGDVRSVGYPAPEVGDAKGVAYTRTSASDSLHQRTLRRKIVERPRVIVEPWVRDVERLDAFRSERLRTNLRSVLKGERTDERHRAVARHRAAALLTYLGESVPIDLHRTDAEDVEVFVRFVLRRRDGEPSSESGTRE